LLQRAYRGILQVNEFTATELTNQPEISILHTDSIFYYIIYLLSLLLEMPNSFSIGINQMDTILTNEKDQIDINWQTIRKHAKRDYMRELQLYEEEQVQLALQTAGVTGVGEETSDEKLSQVKERAMNTIKKMNKVVNVFRQRSKPKEPDLIALRTVFEQDAGLELLEKLTILRNQILLLIEQVMEGLRSFVEKFASTKTKRLSDIEAKELIRKEGKLSSQAKNILLHNRKVDALSEGLSENQEEITIDEDDEYTMRAKLLLFVESLYCALNIGVAL